MSCKKEANVSDSCICYCQLCDNSFCELAERKEEE